MQKKQILINAAMSVIETVATSAILFILYIFLLNTIGIEQIGIWSLVLATTSIAQVANFGLSGSIVKFVAKYIALGEEKNVSAIIQTAFLSISAFVGVFLMICYPFAKWLLGLVVPIEALPYALSILPYAFFSLWIMIITSIFKAGLDGYQRIDLRSLLVIAGLALHLLLCFKLVPNYGLMGVAYANVIQNFTIFLISWFLLKRLIPLLPIIPYKWDKTIFKEIIGYSIKFQMISILTMFYDPITKALLSKFGDLSMVGYFTMANRMIKQIRSLIFSANQVLVPVIANLQEKMGDKIQSVYLTSYQLTFYLALPLYSLIIISTPIISELWIGHYERIFIISATLLSVGLFLNTLAGPAFFTNLGTGELRWNVLAYIAIALLNAGLGLLLGVLYNGIGVVAAWVFSLALGSNIIYVSYHIRHKIPFVELLPKASKIIAIVCLISVFSSLMIHHEFSYLFNVISLNLIIILSFSTVIFVSLWLHPMRKRLIGWVSSELLNKNIRL